MVTIDNIASNPRTTKENIRELTVDELDAASGAAPKLYEAACKGTHLHEVVIEVWRAGGTD